MGLYTCLFQWNLNLTMYPHVKVVRQLKSSLCSVCTPKLTSRFFVFIVKVDGIATCQKSDGKPLAALPGLGWCPRNLQCCFISAWHHAPKHLHIELNRAMKNWKSSALIYMILFSSKLGIHVCDVKYHCLGGTGVVRDLKK